MAYRPKDTQERILHRLKISLGHLKKVMAMVEKDEYCIDVLHQLNAVEVALKQTGEVVMEYHLSHCAADAIKKGNGEKAIKEIMAVFSKRK